MCHRGCGSFDGGSPDGRFILYNNSALKTQFFEYGAVFSPDGKWRILTDESGKAEIYLQAINRGDDSLRVTGERFLISRQGAHCLLVSFEVSGDGSRFVIPSITPRESSALIVLQDWESQVAKLN